MPRAPPSWRASTTTRSAMLRSVCAGSRRCAASAVSIRSRRLATACRAILLAADATSGTAQEMRGLGALAQLPYVLTTRNKAVRTIADFAAADRIAVPALKVSGPALMLQMAATQQWGVEHYDKLDALALA